MSDNNKTSHLTNTFAPFEVAEINPITPLAQRSMFWRPSYLDESAWLEHIPFAFWLAEAHHPRVLVELGAHTGVAYFAFCQGINRLGINTRCFAVDAWKGDEQTFNKLSAYNDAQYSGFSRLVRSSFDDALENFSNGSIDLLHIDELQNYETIRHIFEAWFPKLSDDAVVILHGTNIRERNIGIFKYFEELKEHYPWFEFSHGHGLGILAVGKEQNKILRSLFDTSDIDTSTQVVREVFSRLGRACADSLESINYQNKANELARQIENQTKLCGELKLSLGETKKDLDSRKKEAIEVKAKLQNQIEQHAAERGQLNERVNLLQETRLELKEEVVRIQNRLETAFVRLAEKEQELTRLAIESADFQRKISSYGDVIKERESKLAESLQALQESRTTNAQLTQALAEKDQALNQAISNTEQRQQALQESYTINAQLTQALAEKDQALNEAVSNTEQRQQALQESRTTNAQLTQALAEKDQALNEARVITDRLDRELMQNSQALHEAKIEADRLSEILAKQEQLLADARGNANALSEQNKNLENKLQTRFKELATLTNMVEARNAELNTYHKDNEQKQQRIDQLTNDIELALAEAIAQKDLISKLQKENTALVEAQKSSSTRLEERFGELAILTKLLMARDSSLAAKNQEIEAGRQRIARLKDTASWKVTKPVRAIARLFDKNQGKLNAQIRLIEQSELFDQQWYIDQYPDVAGFEMDPIKHYLLHGAAEHRNPSSVFDTSWYVNEYKDVAESGINPLLHFIKMGKREGRKPKPV